MCQADWTQHFMNMADGKTKKRQKYYTLKLISQAQQAVEMAKDQLKVIKGKAKSKSRQNNKVKRNGKRPIRSQKNRGPQKKKKTLVLRKGLKPDFFT